MKYVFRRFIKLLNLDQFGSIGYMNAPEEIYVVDGDVAARALTAVATILTKTITWPCEVYDLIVKVATSPTVTAPVLAVTQAPLATGVDSAAKFTVTVPVGAGVGSIWRNRADANGKSFVANIGDVVKVKVTTAATAGTANVWLVVRRSSQLPPTQTAAGYNEVTA